MPCDYLGLGMRL